MNNDVLAVITDPTTERLTGGGREALGLARRIANELDGTVSVAIAGDAAGRAAAEAADGGAARVFAIVTDADVPRGVTLLAGAAEAAKRMEPGVIIVSRGPDALEVAPRLAARLGGGCVMNVTGFETVDGEAQATAAIFGGTARAVYRVNRTGVVVISPASGVAEAPVVSNNARGEIELLSIPAEVVLHVRIVRPPRMPEGPRLEDAAVIVSGGRGLRDGENFGLIRELATALGGLPGASRAIVDDGWARSAEQVGLTGKIVAPQLYVALGISGASQHMAGCSNARTIVAINTDRDAPIFRYARFGIVDDCLAILPELIRAAKQRSSRS